MRHASKLLHLPFSSTGLILGSLLLTQVPAMAEPNCASQVEAYDQLVTAERFEEAQSKIDALVADSSCSGYVIPAQKRLAASRLTKAQKAMEKNAPSHDYVDLLEKADRSGVLWQAAATLGEAHFENREFAEAARSYDKAIEIVKNETLTPHAPAKAQIEGLIDRSAQSRLLAANQAQKDGGGFVKTATRGAEIGGVLSSGVRGVVPHAVPMPITFEYRSATLTAIGEEAALELARAIREQRPAHVKLVGHTDERGTKEFNEKLSLERAEAVAAFLRKSEVEVPVEAAGVGAAEPLRIEEAKSLTQDDIYTLNRRVDWRRE